MTDSLRLPPHSIQAEQAVLGGLLLRNEIFDDIGDMLSEKDFYSAQHRIIFKAIESSLRSGKDADIFTVPEQLGREGTLEHAGGIAYIGSLTQIGSISNAKRYAEILVSRRIERDLLEASVTLGELAYRPESIEERLHEAQSILLQIGESSVNEDPEPVGKYLKPVLEDIERRMNMDGEITGLATGLVDLDAITCGLQPADLIIVAGRPSMGKSALAFQIGLHVSIDGNPALVFSMEMSRKQCIERFISNRGRVHNKGIRTGKMDTECWNGVSKAVGKLMDIPLIIDERPALNTSQVRATAKRTKRKYGLSLVVVDYLQLMSGSNKENRTQEITQISRELKALAKELNVPVVALSQLSRECEKRGNKRPIMSDLRESGAIEQDADVVMFVYRDEVYHKTTENSGVAELLIKKHRMGETGTVYLTYLGEYYRFENTSYRPRPESDQPKKSRGME